MKKPRSRIPLAVGACLFTLTGVTHAESTVGTKAAAEALFGAGLDLSQRGRVAEACAKFDASYQIDPALGTLFRLADCYDRIGRTASAWALFSEAKARAQAAEQTTREAIAAERVKDLELRLSRLSLLLGANAFLPGLELRLNEVVVPQASWGLALPVDPGPQRVRLSAPGHRTWTGTVTIETGPGARKFSVPELERQEGQAVPQPAPASNEPAQSPPYPRWLGYSVAGLGLVGLGFAGAFGYRAYSLNQDSLEQCSSANANACTTRGDARRPPAPPAAAVSTVLTVAGGALFVGGVTLIVLSPPASSRATGSVRLQTTLSPEGARAFMEARF